MAKRFKQKHAIDSKQQMLNRRSQRRELNPINPSLLTELPCSWDVLGLKYTKNRKGDKESSFSILFWVPQGQKAYHSLTSHRTLYSLLGLWHISLDSRIFLWNLIVGSQVMNNFMNYRKLSKNCMSAAKADWFGATRLDKKGLTLDTNLEN